MVNSKPHGFTADYWAIGVIIFELMFGKRPYPGISRREYKERIVNTVVQIKSEEKPDSWSEEARDIINQLLQRKEEQRLGHKGPQSIKDHPWFKDINWIDLLAQKVEAPFLPPNVNYLIIKINQYSHFYLIIRLMIIMMKLI